MKNKMSRLLSLGAISLLGTGLVTFSTSACGYRIPFYNYEQYLSSKGIDTINKDFSYHEFGNSSDFVNLIKNNKDGAGILNIYAAAKLVKEGYLQKIDFTKLFGVQNPIHLYSAKTLQALNYFDKFIFPKGSNDHLYNYIAPYYIQSKVVAYNINRGNHPGHEIQFPDKSWNGILKTLKQNGYHHLGLNNYYRDNLMIGSTMVNKGKHMDNTLNEDNYKAYTKAFTDDLIGNNFPGTEHIYNTDGTSLLLDLTNPNSNEDSAIIYNGDALSAYYSSRNFNGQVDGKNVRVVHPEQSVFQLDGFIIPKQSSTHISNGEIDLLYQDVRNAIYGGANPDFYKKDLTKSPMYTNFLYNLYTNTYSKFEPTIKKKFFKTDDKSKGNEVNEYAYNKIYSLSTIPFDPSSNLAMFISDKLDAIAQNYYNDRIME